VASSVVNRTRVALRCEAGHLVAYRGRALPTGERRLPIDAYPPIPAAPSACITEAFTSMRALEDRYLELTVQRVDRAILSDDDAQLHEAAKLLDRVLEPGNESSMSERRRALLIALVHADLRHAVTLVGRIYDRLDAARAAGVAPEVIRGLEVELREALARSQRRSVISGVDDDANAPSPAGLPRGDADLPDAPDARRQVEREPNDTARAL
jgi:hypothetical protein